MRRSIEFFYRNSGHLVSPAFVWLILLLIIVGNAAESHAQPGTEGCQKAGVMLSGVERQLDDAKAKYRANPTEANLSEISRLAHQVRLHAVYKSSQCEFDVPMIDKPESVASCVKAEVKLAGVERQLAQAKDKYRANPTEAALSEVSRLAQQVRLHGVHKSGECRTASEDIGKPEEVASCLKAEVMLSGVERQLAEARARYRAAPTGANQRAVDELVKKVELHEVYIESVCGINVDDRSADDEDPTDPEELDDWAGTWKNDNGSETVNVSGAGGSISASFNYQSSDYSGSGSWLACKVTGATLSCSWKAQHSDTTKSGTRSGKITMTLSGNVMSGTLTEDAPKWSYNYGYNAQNVRSSMYAGKVWTLTYRRQ